MNIRYYKHYHQLRQVLRGFLDERQNMSNIDFKDTLHYARDFVKNSKFLMLDAYQDAAPPGGGQGDRDVYWKGGGVKNFSVTCPKQSHVMGRQWEYPTSRKPLYEPRRIDAC